ncbi:MAG: ribonuclease P [archaeon]
MKLPNINEIARERIELLLDLAERNLDRPERARRYVELARKIGMKHSIRLKEDRQRFCKKCLIPLVIGKTVSVRISKDGRKIVSCLLCGGKRSRKIF